MDPYIGITDFDNLSQVRNMLAAYKQFLLRLSPYKLHVGVMTSYKILHNKETRWRIVWPAKEKIEHIFSLKETYNCLHYADYNNVSTYHDICEAIGYGGGNLHGLQLDMIWPDPGIIASGVHAARKNVEVILQISKDAFARVENNPQKLVKKLEDYENVIHRVLLDRSMGRGIALDADGLMPFIRAIKNRFPKFGITVAGGLGPVTINLVKPIIKEFPKVISLDAQSKLRPSGQATEPIDWKMAGKYLDKALQLVS